MEIRYDEERRITKEYKRGFFEIGIFRVKTSSNVGTLWRSAYQMGSSGIFTIGRRYPKQASDTVKTYRHIPLREYANLDDFHHARPYGATLIGIEMDGVPLKRFRHPQQAIYLLGAEDSGLSNEAKSQCQEIVSIEAIRTESYNVAVAGSIVMYHRMLTLC